jgi:teichuronic acid exporter
VIFSRNIITKHKQVSSSGMSLKEKSFKGLGWSFVESLSGNGLSFIVGLILARLLSPADFGLVGMTVVVLAISNSIIDFGFTTALIRKGDCTDTDFSTALIFNVLVSLVIYVTIYVSAPLVSTFFGEVRLTGIIRLLSIAILFNAFAIVQNAMLAKRLNFKVISVLSFASAVFGGAVGIYLAVNGFGYWSIICQILAKQFLNVCLVWIVVGWRPTLNFSVASFSYLFHFGYKLVLSGLISTLNTNLYYLIIGKIYSPAQLGFYTRAESFNAIAATNLNGAINRVFLPSLATLQDEPERLRNALKKVNVSSFLVCATIMIFMAATAPSVIAILLGKKWEESIVLLQLMSLASLFLPLNAMNRDMLMIKGRSDLFLRLQVIKMLLVLPGIAVAYFYSMELLLVYSCVASFISFLLNSQYAARLFSYSSWQQLTDLAPVFIIVCISGIAMWLISFTSINVYFLLVSQVCLGTGVLFLSLESTKLDAYVELKKLVFTTLTSWLKK